MKEETVLTFDIGGTSIKYALIGLDGVLGDVHEVPTNAKDGGVEVINVVIRIAQKLYPVYEKIAISTAGQVDRTTGIILYANENIPNYTGLNVKEMVSSQVHGVPVCVENDVNCAALGENVYGAGKNLDNFLCLTFGTGIGGAIIIDNKLYKGHRGVAGEFGHFILYPNGLPCACGLKGCFEQYASVNALIRRVQETGCFYSNGKEVFAQIHSSERVKTIIDEWIDDIARGLSNLVNSFDPDSVILGGGIMNESYIIQEIRKRIPSLLIPSLKDVSILQASLGNSAGLLGAYSLCISS